MSRRLSVATVVLAALLSCTACGGNVAAQGASARVTTPAASSAATARSATPSTAPSTAPSTSSGTPTAADPGADSSEFCATARRLGLDNLRIEDSGNADVSQLLDGLDTLDALAPPDLKADFDHFVGLERAVLDPANAPTGAGADINSPDNLTALGHVEKYLQDTCGSAR
jgi:hypothetical protein